MPLVSITYKTSRQTEWELILNKLRKYLREIVAEALSVPEVESAQLTSEDVELEFREASPYDIGKDLHILVLASYFHDRNANLQVRTNEIASAIDVLVGKYVTGMVYVRLADAGFGEF